MDQHSTPHYLAELVLAGKAVLVAGGGRVARRKIEGLINCQAAITVVAPHLDPVVSQWVEARQITHWPERFSPALLTRPPRPWLVFAATDQATLNQEIARLCTQAGVWCNSADDPGVSGLLVPAVVRRGEVVVAVGTGGGSPALSRVIKERIDAWLEPGWAGIAAAFKAWRGRVAQQIPDSTTRQNFWRHTAQAAAHPEQGALHTDAESWLLKQLSDYQSCPDDFFGKER
ncbi:MAG: bifunctional precorrin-2 dehydrogenase/sirohydrochlorin ferrochelatase [Magnetococcales bacterium]|nr:bifunctional precorrin-2 dehydrogenase/sirohydrochlorin ferrochelatase [Magnetococcales bacterium]